MTPSQLSHELRNETTPDLARRRWILGLSLIGVAAGKIVSLFQMGIIRRLPDPPVGVFDSSKVDASDYAYKRMNMPDAPLMIVNYGITACLAAAGGKDRAEQHPALPIALAAKTLIDVATTAKLTQEEWRENKALCSYCQAATVVSLASAVLAMPEAIRAVQRLAGGNATPARTRSMRHRVAELVGGS